MSDPIFFAPLRVPVVDPRTGLMSREWYLFLQAMFLRIGGTNGQSIDDVLQGVPEELGAAELLSMQLTAFDAVGQLPAIPTVISPDVVEVNVLRDQIAELTKRLDDIQQGTML